MSDHKSKLAKAGAEPESALEQPAAAKLDSVQPTYPVSEFITNARRTFGVSKDLAAAAFQCSGKAECTQSDAKGIIEQFRKRKVK